MLTEDEVVKSLVKYLEREDYFIERFSLGTERGHDIEGKTPEGRSLYIECKGSISPKTGKSFDTNGKWSRASSAVFHQLRHRASDPNAKIGIALPDDEYYRETLIDDNLKKLLKSLDIDLYWVSESGYEN